MFGKILAINDNLIRVENTLKKAEISLVGINVIFQKNDIKFVGVVEQVDEEFIDINLIGEIISDKFISGIIKKPNLESSCRIITKRELEYLLGEQSYSSKDTLLIGKSAFYEAFNVTVSKSDFFSSHFAILGNTGSGKSCGMARILQNVFYYNDEAIPKNAHFVIFDAYAEHSNAFKNLNRIKGLNFKSLSCDIDSKIANYIKIPSYFLGVDELAILLDCQSIDLIPVLESTLRLVYIFNSNDETLKIYKNSIIANSIQDILVSGNVASQIRDQIIAVLTKYHTDDINLDSIISQPGYDRTLRQCLIIDNQGKMNAINLVMDYLAKYLNTNIDNLEIEKGFYYTLNDLSNALDFSLINEGILSSSTTFARLNTLRVRLRSLIDSNLASVFEYNDIISREEYVKSLFTNEFKENVQVLDISFGSIDERYSKVITKLLSKIFYDFASTNINRGSFPIHILIEEAHRYVQQDIDKDIIGYNIFERITKEGRKYGIILGLITQRPTELSKTVLSQCANFLVFRMQHPDDLDIITSISTNVTSDLKERIKILHSGMALCFGTSFKIPSIVQLDLPDPMPVSSNIEVTKLWY